MKEFDQFHDGFLRGVLLDGATVRVFLSTENRQEYALEIRGVLSLKVDGFREGNIIYDVLVRNGDEITLQDMMNFYDFRDEANAARKLEETRRGDLIVLEINPSYGAICNILGKSVELLPRPGSADQDLASATD